MRDLAKGKGKRVEENVARTVRESSLKTRIVGKDSDGRPLRELVFPDKEASARKKRRAIGPFRELGAEPTMCDVLDAVLAATDAMEEVTDEIRRLGPVLSSVAREVRRMRRFVVDGSQSETESEEESVDGSDVMDVDGEGEEDKEAEESETGKGKEKAT